MARSNVAPSAEAEGSPVPDFVELVPAGAPTGPSVKFATDAGTPSADTGLFETTFSSSATLIAAISSAARSSGVFVVSHHGCAAALGQGASAARATCAPTSASSATPTAIPLPRLMHRGYLRARGSC